MAHTTIAMVMAMTVFVSCVATLTLGSPVASTLDLSGAPVVGQTNKRYASWTIDSSYNRGFVHIDFNNANLLAGATSLAPSTIRFGGGGNDYLQYAPFSPCTANNDSDTHVCLNTSHWDSLYKMANKSGCDFLFGVSFDMIKACEDKDEYKWVSEPAAAMIKYIQQQKQTIWGYELGNEVNNRHKSCGLRPAQQAAAFKVFAATLAELYPDVTTRPKLIGPDVGYYDPQMWLSELLGNFSEFHAITYHVYSWLNKRNFDLAMPIDNALTDGESWYPGLVKAMAPGAEVWAGEDGPISGGEDGTCGGMFSNGSSTNKSVCGTYATIPWYANDLGVRATLGFKQYQRQDLIGGRYGLMGIPHDNEMLGTTDAVRLNPDFWINFMWKRVMGDTVLNVTAGNSGGMLDAALRVYAHCGVPPSPFAPTSTPPTPSSPTTPSTPTSRSTSAASSATPTPMGLVLININSTSSRVVKFATDDTTHTVWTITPGGGGVFGETSLMNGIPLQATITDSVAIGNIPVKGKVVKGSITLPPFSVTFAISECTTKSVFE